jgi:hypothetical protein
MKFRTEERKDAPPSVLSILDKIQVYKRPTWMPVVQQPADDELEEALVSKIGGQAYLPPGESYPLCPNCNEPMTLFLQLNPGLLPPNCDLDLENNKLIQLFYCTNTHPNCELECKGWQPFSKNHTILQPLIPSNDPTLPANVPPRSFKAGQVVEWIEQEDYPDWHEMQLGEAGLTEAEIETLEESEVGVPKAADKLGGWPYWVQSVEYPKCPECGLQMQMIFQLDSKHHLPYEFGDAGIGYLHQCRLHKNQLAFGWASY